MTPPSRGLARATALLLGIALAAVSTACASEAGDGDGARDVRPLVVASIFPVGDLAAFLGGEDVRVEVLLPPRASPSTFEPTARLVARLAGGEGYLFVGGGMDPWAAQLVSDADGAVVVELVEGLALLDGHEHEGHEGTGNPHVWLDPVLVRDRLLPRIEGVLVAAAPGAREAIARRRLALADSLTALDLEIEATLAGVPSRGFVGTHAAWGYFAKRYGLVEVGAVYASPGREPSTRGLARLVEEARRQRVRAVFMDPQLGEAGARAVADELGLEPVLLDPLGGAGLPGRDGYLRLMRFNAAQMARALGAVP